MIIGRFINIAHYIIIIQYNHIVFIGKSQQQFLKDFIQFCALNQNLPHVLFQNTQRNSQKQAYRLLLASLLPQFFR